MVFPEHDDPLDEYMKSIDKEVETLEKKPISNNNHLKDEEEVVGAEEAEEGTSENKIDDEKLRGMSVEEIIALAQKKAKKKDLSQIDHRSIQYPPFRKDFYVVSPEIARMTEEEVVSIRNDLDGIKIRGQKCPRPVRKWTQCGLNSKVLDIIKRSGYERPTPIQAQAIPAVMSGRDIIGIAKTGSGKTIAFILPMLRHVLDQPKLLPFDGPIALIMTPTRELAMQTFSECKKFSIPIGLNVVCAYGGAPIKDQIADLKRGAEILICTPGRLIDLLLANSGKVTNLRRVTFLVLDEADRMFDMGFGPQVLKIIDNIRPDKQTVLFSATFPPNMESLARKILVRPLEIVVGQRSTVSADVEQLVEVVEQNSKFLKLLDVLGRWYETKSNRILIFVDRQEAADTLLRDLIRRGYHCNSLHGGKDQADRDCAISDFKCGIVPILIATSVAARGLDVKDLKLVINYECPNHMEDYVHRVGRTGRAGNKGTAITFITVEQERYAPEIVKALRASKVAVPATLQKLADAFSEKLKTGQAMMVGSGFGGKGLERLDEGHERLRKTRKILSADADELSSSSSDDEGEEEVIRGENMMADVIKPAVPGAQSQGGKQETAKKSKVEETKDVRKPKSEEAKGTTAKEEVASDGHLPGSRGGRASGSLMSLHEVARLINANLAARGGVMDAEEPVDYLKVINARYRAVPADGGGEKAAPSSSVANASSTTVVTATARSFYAEIEINDSPPAARTKITQKDTISAIMELSGAVLTIRGEHIPAGKSLREGQRKLHIRIDGVEEMAVERALKEIKRTLYEAVTEAASDRGTLEGYRIGSG